MKSLYSNSKGSALQSIIIGILLLVIGFLILFFLAEDNIKSFLKHYNSLDENNAQSQTIDSDSKAQSGNKPLIDSYETSTGNHNLDSHPTAQLTQGELSEVHGFGSKDHLTKVPSKYSSKNELVHRDVYEPLISLIQDAAKDNIKINIVSAYRSYEHQKSIWERKWGGAAEDDTLRAQEILTYSSFPGTSRHHWGTDIDFNSVSLEYWSSAEGKKVYDWLQENAPKYGFCQTYAPGRKGRGYEDEPWHWSHMNTARSYYEEITNGQALAAALSQNVKGSNAVQSIASQVTNYITNISSCTESRHNGYKSTSNFAKYNNDSIKKTNHDKVDISKHHNFATQTDFYSKAEINSNVKNIDVNSDYQKYNPNFPYIDNKEGNVIITTHQDIQLTYE